MYYEEKQATDGTWWARTSPTGLWHLIPFPMEDIQRLVTEIVDLCNTHRNAGVADVTIRVALDRVLSSFELT